MEYDHIRLAFSLVLFGLGLLLVIGDFVARRSYKSHPTQRIRFGAFEVSTTSLGFAIIALAVPILLLSRVSIEQAEFRARQQLVTPLFKAYQSSINAYFDLKKLSLQEWLDREYLPEFVKKLKLEAAEANLNLDDDTMAKSAVRELRLKERELIDSLDKKREQLLESANAYIVAALNGDVETNIQTLEQEIAREKTEVDKEVEELIQKMIKILPKVIPPFV